MSYKGTWLLIVLFSTAFAADIQITIGSAETYWPANAYDGTNYLVAWMQQGNGIDIYGQLVSPSGALVGSNFQISTTGQGLWPALAFGGTNYLAVWSENNAFIYGQLVSPAGTLVDTAFQISTIENVAVGWPAVVYNGTDYLVIWMDNRNTPDFHDIYGQRISSSGAPIGNNFPVSVAEGNQMMPAVAWDGTRFLVVWQDVRSGSSDIYGRRVSASGSLVGGEILVSTAAEGQTTPATAYNGTDYLVVWDDSRSGHADIYGQRINTSGSLVGSNFQISTSDSNEVAASVVYDGRNYFVVWQDYRSDVFGDIYGQRVSSSGTLVSYEIPISTAASYQYNVRVACDGEHYLVVWNDNRDDGITKVYANIDVEAGMYDVAPVSIDIPSSVPEDFALSPKATVKNSGTHNASFNVTCMINPGVYTATTMVNNLIPNDSLQVTFSPDFTFVSGGYTVKVYTQLGSDMNQANDTLVKVINASGVAENETGAGFSFRAPAIITGKANLEISLPGLTKIALLVYDVAGCQCQTLLNQRLGAGVHSFSVDLDLPAGIYFYALKIDAGEHLIKKFLLVR